jgi:lipoprotein-releasing system permease protein
LKLIFNIAWRYLVGRKSAQAINIITWISMVGMAIGTTALMLILSVFNGFEDLLSGMLSTFNPDIKVVLVEGKFADVANINVKDLKSIKGVSNISLTLEETAFFEYNGSQEVGIIKGVDSSFMNVTGLDSSIVGGKVRFGEDAIHGVIGIGMYNKLSINSGDPFTTIACYMPTKGSAALDKGFKSLPIYPSASFSVGGEIDQQYILVDIEVANELLERENSFSAIEFRIDDESYNESIKEAISQKLGPKYKIMDKYQQDEAFLRIMNIEKWISYLIACLTLLIIAFNMIGSIWMLIIEKTKDIAILKSMGMRDRQVRWIFLGLGLLISGLGLIVGLILASILYYGQKTYGWVSIPEGFLIDAYPIKWLWRDMIVVTFTVFTIGYIASVIPSQRAGKISKLVSALNR